MKSRCRSMMTRAVFAQSSSIGSGSAEMVPREYPFELAMTCTPPNQELSGESEAKPVPLCTIGGRGPGEMNSLRIQSVEFAAAADSPSTQSLLDVQLPILWAHVDRPQTADQ